MSFGKSAQFFSRASVFGTKIAPIFDSCGEQLHAAVRFLHLFKFGLVEGLAMSPEVGDSRETLAYFLYSDRGCAKINEEINGYLHSP